MATPHEGRSLPLSDIGEVYADFERKVGPEACYQDNHTDTLAARSQLVAQIAILLARDVTVSPYLADRPITEGKTPLDILTDKELSFANEAMRVLGQALGYPMQGESVANG